MEQRRKYPIDKPEKEYAEMVRVIFSRVVNRYDFMNRLLSMGLDVYWRKKTVKALDLKEGTSFLDLACGTGDLGIFVAKVYPHFKILAVDFNLDMLFSAVKKVKREGLYAVFNFAAADANSLPFKDETFDATGIAFGLRNIPSRDRALKEMVRVTKKGGKILVLEMTSRGSLSPIWRFYIRYVMPLLAKVFSKDADAYLYLYDTISSFPSVPALKKEIEEIGLKDIQVLTFWPGITHLLSGTKT